MQPFLVVGFECSFDRLVEEPVLKPQDLLVALKIAAATGRAISFAELGRELFMSASEAHAATRRALSARLLGREDGMVVANRASPEEFLIRGAKYAFPAVVGPVTRGLLTGASAEPLRPHFEQSGALPWIWPDPEGQTRGISVCPLYPSVPAACREDAVLYRMLTVFEALRGGVARERELAERTLAALLR